MSAAVDYTYRYARASSAEPNRVSLSTFTGGGEQPYFFRGDMLYPRETAQMLSVLSEVVRTHFFLQRPPLLDPVLTSNDSVLRLEGFSGCCGAYVRADLSTSSFQGEQFGRGTTNVDFNEPMRRALRQVRAGDRVGLSVGAEQVVLERAGCQAVEKKVKLPVRWVKAFGEVQAYQTTLRPYFEIAAKEALRFVRSLPRASAPKKASFVVPSGPGLRLSQRRRKGAPILRGTHRLAVLEPLLAHAHTFRVWFDPDTEVSGWEVVTRPGRFLLLLSPEVYRGFSGEGQLLHSLASRDGKALVSKVRAQLRWQARIVPSDLAAKLEVEACDIENALAVLGARGLAGYDALKGAYFHRELPFDLDQVESLQPRLKNARKLVTDGHVQAEEAGRFLVQGTKVRHHVRLEIEGGRCTCPWFSKFQGRRGPCKHILAAQLVHDD